MALKEYQSNSWRTRLSVATSHYEHYVLIQYAVESQMLETSGGQSAFVLVDFPIDNCQSPGVSFTKPGDFITCRCEYSTIELQPFPLGAYMHTATFKWQEKHRKLSHTISGHWSVQLSKGQTLFFQTFLFRKTALVKMLPVFAIVTEE